MDAQLTQDDELNFVLNYLEQELGCWGFTVVQPSTSKRTHIVAPAGAWIRGRRYAEELACKLRERAQLIWRDVLANQERIPEYNYDRYYYPALKITLGGEKLHFIMQWKNPFTHVSKHAYGSPKKPVKNQMYWVQQAIKSLQLQGTLPKKPGSQFTEAELHAVSVTAEQLKKEYYTEPMQPPPVPISDMHNEHVKLHQAVLDSKMYSITWHESASTLTKELMDKTWDQLNKKGN